MYDAESSPSYSATPAASAQEIKPGTAVMRIAVKIPPFYPADPEMWFRMAELSFDASGITTDATRLGYIIGALEPTVAAEVRDVIIEPPAGGAYQRLKTELIKRLSSSQEEKTRRLFEHEEMGDRKPSQFLRHLKTLAGTTVGDSLLRTIWTGRLPSPMQAILATQRDAPLDQVAELADTIAETSGRHHVSAVTPSALEHRIEELEANIRALNIPRPFQGRDHQRRQYRSQPHSQQSAQRYANKKGHCWYHNRHGVKADKCTPPCTFASGN